MKNPKNVIVCPHLPEFVALAKHLEEKFTECQIDGDFRPFTREAEIAMIRGHWGRAADAWKWCSDHPDWDGISFADSRL